MSDAEPARTTTLIYVGGVAGAGIGYAVAAEGGLLVIGTVGSLIGLGVGILAHGGA